MASSISWPVTMPKPLQSGFSMQPEDRRTASSTVGTSFQKGFGGDVCVAECTVLLSPAQSAWLEKFERDTLVQGSRWFSFPVWYAGQIHWEHCRFKTRPKAGSLVGRHTQCQFSLYVRRRTELMPDCMVKVFSCFPPCAFVELDSWLAVFLAGSQEWISGIADRMDNAFQPLFGVLGLTTRTSVASALSEITEE